MKKKILIVIADYYKDIADGLLKSALKLISKKNNIKVINVPGAFEIPVTISKNINKHDAFLALGCVIKGQTPHFDFISQAAIRNILNELILDAGYKTRIAANYNQALSEIDKKMPDVAILDVKLDKGDNDGIELLSHIKSKNKDVPVIIIRSCKYRIGSKFFKTWCF